VNIESIQQLTQLYKDEEALNEEDTKCIDYIKEKVLASNLVSEQDKKTINTLPDDVEVNTYLTGIVLPLFVQSDST
jgi:hypothetical protein